MHEYVLRKDEEIICEICMNRLKTAIKLSCGHCFHSGCILKMLQKNKKRCPICNSPFDRHYGSSICNDNVLGNIVKGMLNPLLQRQRRISQRDVDEVVRIFPNVPRWDIEAEIMSVNDLQQAIINMAYIINIVRKAHG